MRTKRITKPYQYKTRKKKVVALPLNRVREAPDKEELSGMVNGVEASDLEERFARQLGILGIPFAFQYGVWTGMSSKENSVDFILATIPVRAVEIDGEFAHKTVAQKSKDDERDAIVNDVLAEEGISPIERISYDKIQTPEMTRKLIRDNYL